MTATTSPKHTAIQQAASIAFIGAGNMASSIIGGLIEQGYPASVITACDPNESALAALHTRFEIQSSTDNIAACSHCDVIVLAVKPQVLQKVAEGLQTALKSRSEQPLVISIAAGTSSQHITQWLGRPMPIVRCMPNTPALVQQGASGLYANANTSDTHKQLAQQLLEAVGYVTWLDDEAQIDAVTAVSGSGPAYFFLMIESMIEAGIKQGLSKEAATQLTLQTALGAATLAKGSDVAVDELRRRVTSPAGTTEQAILYFEEHKLRDVVEGAMAACADRSREMAKELD